MPCVGILTAAHQPVFIFITCLSMRSSTELFCLWTDDKPFNKFSGAFNRGEELQAKPSAFVRFISSSESYITISKGSLSASSKFNLNLKFRTFNKNGIIFFLGQDISDSTVDKPDYFKLYMLDGKV